MFDSNEAIRLFRTAFDGAPSTASLREQALDFAAIAGAAGYHELEAHLRNVSNPPIKMGGRELPTGDGWRIINSQCIEVDGVRYVFEHIKGDTGWRSKDRIGADHITVDNSAKGDDLARLIREALA